MKAKLGHLLNATLYFEAMQNPQIDTPMKRLVNLQLPGSQAFRLVQITRSIEGHLKDFEEARQKLIGKHAVEVDGQKSVPATNQDAFTADLSELASTDIEIPGDKIRIETMSHAPMTASDLYALSFLFAGLSEEEAPKTPAPAVVKNGKKAKVTSA